MLQILWSPENKEQKWSKAISKIGWLVWKLIILNITSTLTVVTERGAPDLVQWSLTFPTLYYSFYSHKHPDLLLSV